MNLSHFLSAHRLTVTRLVPVVVVAAFWLLGAHPSVGLLAAGSVLALAGQALRVWAAGHLVKDRALTATGPFAYTRHPLYLGSTLIGLGLCVASGIWWAYLLIAIVFVLFYIPTAAHEESCLSQQYGEAYARYRATVPGLGLRLPRYRTGGAPARAAGREFAWDRVLRNGEQQTVMATALLLAAMWAKLALAGAGP